MKPTFVKQKTNMFIGITITVFIITTITLYWKLSSFSSNLLSNESTVNVSHNEIVVETGRDKKVSFTLNTQFRTEQNTAVKPLDNIHKAAYAMAAKFRCVPFLGIFFEQFI
jgi:hypothetical protein